MRLVFPKKASNENEKRKKKEKVTNIMQTSVGGQRTPVFFSLSGVVVNNTEIQKRDPLGFLKVDFFSFSPKIVTLCQLE